VLRVRVGRRICRNYTVIVRQPKSSFDMEDQLIEVDSIADLRVALEDAVGPDAAVNVGGNVLPEQPEVEVLGEAKGFAAEDLGDIDIETPSRTADSISATAGTSSRRANSLLDNLSRWIVPSWLGWLGRGVVRSDPVALRHIQQHSRGGSRSTRSVDRVPDSSGIPAHPRMYETPRNPNAIPQGQIRQESAYAAPLGLLQRAVRDSRRDGICKPDFYSSHVCGA